WSVMSVVFMRWSARGSRSEDPLIQVTPWRARGSGGAGARRTAGLPAGRRGCDSSAIRSEIVPGGLPMSGTTTSPATPQPRGLDGVVAAQTRLSHVDGLAGELIIGGYALHELAGKVSFEEAAHLLWRGALPGRDELAALRDEMAKLRRLPAETLAVVRA